MEINAIIDFSIHWGPTILFLLGIIFGILLGYLRGFRRSLIFFIHSLIAGLICFVGYIVITNMPQMDQKIFSGMNQILNLFGKSLQGFFSVSSECDSLTSVLMEFLPQKIGYENIFSIFLLDNGAYFASLVNMGYHLFIAVFMIFVYLFLDFVLYLIYLFFYSNDKYLRRIEREQKKVGFLKLNTKKRGFGMLLSGFRSFLAGLIGLSFLGSFFFILAGGKGKDSLKGINLGDPSLNSFYNAYCAIGSYGQEGIFKILNGFSNKEDVPYYLFAADLIFQGELQSDEYQGNIYFRDEFATYIQFSRETFEMLLKYDKAHELKKVLANKSDRNPMDVLLEVMSDEDFKQEFELLIDEFEGKPFLTNLAFSLANTLVKNRELFLKDIPETTSELFQIFFTGENAIKVTDIIGKEDSKTILKLILTFLTPSGEDNLSKEERFVYDLNRTVPLLKDLTIIKNPDKSLKINSLLMEAYDYILQNMLGKKDSSSEPVLVRGMLREMKLTVQSIDWYTELNQLINLLDDGLYLYSDLYLPYIQREINFDFEKFIFQELFNHADPLINQKNEAVYDNLTYSFANSKLLSKFFSSGFMFEKIQKVFTDSFKIVIPNTIIYHNTYSKEGILLEYGEAYYLLTTLKSIAKNENLRAGYEKLKNLNFAESGVEIIREVSGILNTKIDETSEKTLIDALLSSKIMQYVMSGVLMNSSFSNDPGIQYMRFYFPKGSLTAEIYENKAYYLIERNQLIQIFKSLPEIIDIIEPILNSSDLQIDAIMQMMKSDVLYQILEKNLIIEGTLSNIILNIFKNFDQIEITNTMNIPENWLSSSSQKGELLKIMDALKISNLDLSALLDNQISVETIIQWNLTDESAAALLESKLLYYTLSKALSEVTGQMSFNLVIPYDSIDRTIKEKDLNGKNIEIIKKSEIIDLLTKSIHYFPQEGEEIDLQKIIQNKNTLLKNAIIHASLINYLMRILPDTPLTIPQKYVDSANQTQLKLKNNLWFKTNELSHLLDAMNIIFKITSKDFDIHNIDINSLKNSVLALNQNSHFFDIDSGRYYTQLEICGRSVIIMTTITRELDHILVPDLIDGASLHTLKNENMYSVEELRNLINALNVMNISDLNDISIDLIEGQITTLKDYIPEFDSKKLDVLYLSTIIALALSKQLDLNFKNMGVHEDVLQALKYQEGIRSEVYQKPEIYKILDATEILGISDINQISEYDFAANIQSLNDFSESFQKTKLQVLYKSLLLRDIITQTMDDLIRHNPQLTYVEEAKEKVNFCSVKFYRLSELENLISIMNGLNVEFQSFNFDRITFTELRYYADKSMILDASISSFITKGFIVSADLWEIYKINTVELNLFYDALECYGLSNMAYLEILLPEDQLLDILLKSTIIRGTITSKMISNQTLFIENQSQYVHFTKDIEGNNRLILSAGELRNIAQAIRILTPDSTSFDIQVDILTLSNLSVDNVVMMIQSNVMNLMISSLLKNLQTIFVPTKVSAFNLSQITLSEAEKFTDEEIISILALLI